MPEKRHIVDQIVGKLRKADLELGKGKKVPEVCRLLEVVTNVNEQTYLSLTAEVRRHEARDGQASSMIESWWRVLNH